MRRKEKEITDQKELVHVIEKAEICRLAMINDNRPYIIPMNFGYKENFLYFHSAKEGRKIEILRENPSVCFEIESETSLIESDVPCSWSMKFRSVIGQGMVEFIENPADKSEALDIIMNHYSPEVQYSYPEAMIKKVALFRIQIEEMRGKESGFKKDKE